jgi:hypothetical protein
MFGILHKARLLLPLTVEVNKGLAVNLNFAVIDLLKTVQQANEGGFPRADGPMTETTSPGWICRLTAPSTSTLL